MQEQKQTQTKYFFLTIDTLKKSRIQETLNRSTCVNRSTITKKKKLPRFQVSHVTCHQSPVTCHMSLTPTATATDLPPANSPTAPKGWHQRHSGGWFAKTLKSTFFCGAILDRFWVWFCYALCGVALVVRSGEFHKTCMLYLKQKK